MKRFLLLMAVAITGTMQVKAQQVLEVHYSAATPTPTLTLYVTADAYDDVSCTYLGTSNPIPITCDQFNPVTTFTVSDVTDPSFWPLGNVPGGSWHWDGGSVFDCIGSGVSGAPCSVDGVSAVGHGATSCFMGPTNCFVVSSTAASACTGSNLTTGDRFNMHVDGHNGFPYFSVVHIDKQ